MLQATIRTTALFFICFIIPHVIHSQADCNNAATLTVATSCSNTQGNLKNASSISPTGSCGGATATTTYGIWYKFTATASTATITVSGLGSSLSATTTYVELLTGSCGSFTSTCQNVASALNVTGLTITSTYYIRVYVTTNPTLNGNPSQYDLSICVVSPPGPPANDDCSNAITLTSATSCSNTSGTLVNSTASAGLPAGCESAGTHYDAWYKFVASSNSHTITISSLGTNFTSSEIQLYSGACGSLISKGCGTTSVTSSSLSSGTTYYIRVSNIGSSPASNGGFNICVTHPAPPVTYAGGRMNEVYKQTVLSGSGALQYPWEITYGPDNNLWITEARGYKVYKMDPNTGVKTTVLDLNSTSTDLSAWGADSLRAVNLTSTSNWNATANAWPQGGLAGLALHPNFMDGTGLHDFVYISYVHRYLSTASGSAGIFFRNKIVRFVYNSGTGKLGSPAVVCDTIPGGQDHNSQRMIIAPVTSGGTYYLFYACGDMGSGQFANRLRPNNAQNPASYEGKILRFNLEPIAGSWIPNDNPYSVNSAVYSIGIRNNQGFAYDSTTNTLYGSSHGPYSDDEINIIEGHRNYGHPLIEGFVDGNYNGNSAQGTNTSISAGAPWTDNSGVSTCPPIGNEATNKTTIDANGNGLYKDPLFSAYAASAATVTNIWQTNPGNANPAPGWPTEAWSGLDLYNNTLIPGWKNSLVASSLKWGRLVRLRLNGAGNATAPTNTVSDTVTYFNSQNRFRDLAFSPNGKDIFVIMDNSSTTSGPGSANPVVPNCAGCVQKYTFLGYYDVAGKSSIPASIDVTSGTANTCNTGTTITIDNTNNYLWVPITGPDGNIMAEIKANGNNLGTVISSFYIKGGPGNRSHGAVSYLNRNMTITPAVQPSSPVDIRLYFSKAEYDALDIDPLSGISAIGDVKILKNNDPCSNAIQTNTTLITPTNSGADLVQGTNGYVLQASINSFSSFYFGSTNIILPLNLLTFTGTLQNNTNALLNWKTSNEINTSHFVIERSIDGTQFVNIGQVNAKGTANTTEEYNYTDNNIDDLQVLIVYYRLKMIDSDGSSKYSKVISISLADITGKISVAPNPVYSTATISISAAQNGKVQWSLFNNTGHLIMYNQFSVKRGVNNSFEIPMEKLATGSYYIKLTGAGIDKRIKIEKLKL